MSRTTRVSIGPARSDELPSLALMVEDLFRREADFRPDADTQLRGLRLLIAAPADRARIAVARGAEGPVGLAVAQLVVSTAQGGLSAWIEDVYVRPAWRGRGVGRSLLEHLLDWARVAGATRAQLLADRDNAAAIGFYRRLGWCDTALLPLRRCPGTDGSPRG